MKSNLDFIHVTLASVLLGKSDMGGGRRWEAVDSNVRWDPTRQRLFQVAWPPARARQPTPAATPASSSPSKVTTVG